MAQEVLTYGPALLAWAAVGYKWPTLRRCLSTPSVRAYWFTLLALALSLTVLLPPVYVALDRLAGVPNLSRLLGHSLMLVAAWSVQRFLHHLAYPERSLSAQGGRHGWLLFGALVLLAALFRLADTREEAIDFTSRYADAPYIFEYRLVLLAYLGLALTNVARLSWRYAGLSSSRPSLHLGLRLVALGGLVGLGYVAHGVLYLGARRLGLEYPLGDGELASNVFIAGCVGLVVVGSTMPTWGPRVGIPALYRWGVQYRSLWRLYPLWFALYRATPEIALLPPRSRLADALVVRDLGFRRYRRLVEIRDGRLALRGYFDPRVAACARNLCLEANMTDENTEAVVEAASLAAAIRSKMRARRALQTSPLLATSGGTDVMSEALVLERIARSFEHSPIVRTVVARVEQEERPGQYRAEQATGPP